MRRMPILLETAWIFPKNRKPGVVPEADELSPTTVLEISERGGHVGYVNGTTPWRPRYWLEQRIPRYLETYVKSDL